MHSSSCALTKTKPSCYWAFKWWGLDWDPAAGTHVHTQTRIIWCSCPLEPGQRTRAIRTAGARFTFMWLKAAAVFGLFLITVLPEAPSLLPPLFLFGCIIRTGTRGGRESYIELSSGSEDSFDDLPCCCLSHWICPSRICFCRSLLLLFWLLGD